MVAVAALETLVDVFDEVVVTSVLEAVFALLVLLKLEEVDLVDDVEGFMLLVLAIGVSDIGRWMAEWSYLGARAIFTALR